MRMVLIRTFYIAAVALIGCASASALTITYYPTFTGYPANGPGAVLGVGWPYSGTPSGPFTITAVHFPMVVPPWHCWGAPSAC
jgi:hypothetical protein